MKVTYGRGTTVYGPGVEVKLTGNEVAEAIVSWIGTKGVQIKGPRTVRSVNGELMAAVEVYVDPSGVVETPDGYAFSGRGQVWTDKGGSDAGIRAESSATEPDPA